jgi:type I restriction enzyme S subunit
MSRIDTLISKVAPAGVKFELLGDIAELVRGNGMPKADLTYEGVGAIHYGQIYTLYDIWTTSTVSFVAPATAAKLTQVRPGDIIITNTSENLEDVGKAVAWLGEDTIVTGGHATAIRHSQDPKYLAYWFQSESFFAQKRALATGTKVIDVSARQLAKVRIPVPPIEVQHEIVSILDRFTALEAELAAALDAELDSRQSQYSYYRQLMLEKVAAQPVPVASLGTWYGGMTPSKSNPAYWESGSIPWLASMDVSDTTTEAIRGRVTSRALAETSLRVIPAPSVAVVMRSNILRRVLPMGLIQVDTTLNQDVRALVPREGVSADYVYQALRADSERLRGSVVRTDGSMAAVESKRFFDWCIPLPSLDEQRRIADDLRKFESSVSDLAKCLPAELNARRQQYEYYRDKLLTFEEAVP